MTDEATLSIYACEKCKNKIPQKQIDDDLVLQKKLGREEKIPSLCFNCSIESRLDAEDEAEFFRQFWDEDWIADE